MSMQKHESDMTRKEKRQQRRLQLKSLTGKEKMEYIWTYYKMEIGLLVLFIIVGIFALQWLMNLRYDEILYIGVVNNADCRGEEIAKDYKQFINNHNRFDKVDVDTTIQIDQNENNNSDFYGTYRFTLFTSTPLFDVVIVNKDIFENCKSLDTFEDLTDLVSEAGADLTAVTDKTGYDLQGNEKLASYGINTDEPVYLMMNRQSENEKYVVEFLRFLEYNE